MSTRIPAFWLPRLRRVALNQAVGTKRGLSEYAVSMTARRTTIRSLNRQLTRSIFRQQQSSLPVQSSRRLLVRCLSSSASPSPIDNTKGSHHIDKERTSPATSLEKHPQHQELEVQEIDDVLPPAMSKRRQFKQTQVHPGILAFIRSTGLGILPRENKFKRLNKITQGHRLRGQREADMMKLTSPDYFKKRNSKENARMEPTTEAPLPFGHDKFPVRVVAELANPRHAIPKFLDGIAQDAIPHIAVCGRSNVGKSTLLNALLYGNRRSSAAAVNPITGGRRLRARNFQLPRGVKASTSHRPGHTRKITFYQLGAPSTTSTFEEPIDLRLLLVDLPGYGFAYASEQDAQNYKQMMTQYLTGSGTLAHRTKPKRILLLIDSRHGLKKADIDFLESIQLTLLKESVDDVTATHNDDKSNSNSKRLKQRKKRVPELPPIQIVLTKCDLVHQIDLARRVVQVRQQLSDILLREPSQLPVMMTSNRTTQVLGVLELQKELASLAVAVKPVKPKRNKNKKPKLRETVEESTKA